MAKFIIVTDSCSDFPNELVLKHELNVLPLMVHFGEETFKNFPDEREISNKAFYDRLRNKQIGKTSQVNPEDYVSFVEPLLIQGLDVLTISLSSALSGSCNSMVVGRAQLLEKYPDRKIVIVDSLNASMGQGLLVYKAILLQKAGKTLEKAAEAIEALKLKICSLFTVADLGTLQRGGRISLTASFLGNLLQLKPVLHVSNEGKLEPWGKVRGRKAAILAMLEKMDQQIADDEVIFLSHADCEDEALSLKEEILKRHPNNKTFVISSIGPVIGAHSGPGTLAVFYVGKAR
jgi:DegV family protein with EDD domain